MEAIQLYTEYKKELKFLFIHSNRTDLLRGSILGLATVLLLGIPTYIGYLSFMLRGQSKNADFLPPLDPEMIGEYTFIGAKTVSLLSIYILFATTIIWGVIQIPVSQLIRSVVVSGLFFIFAYITPSVFYLTATTEKLEELNQLDFRDFFSVLIAYEYMTLMLFSILVGVMVAFLFTVLFLFIVTLPFVFAGIWYVGVTYTRLVGHAIDGF